MSPWSMVMFRAMGSPCRVVAPDAELAQFGQQIVLGLERRWSRFLADSEVSSLNRCAGRLSLVSLETFRLIDCAQQAREFTGGVFNPLGLDQLEAIGYDRTWADVTDSAELAAHLGPMSDERIELYPEVNAVCLPAGTRFDPGGIGKGLAGDIVADTLREAGATSVQVELGGDIRVAGPEWSGGSWDVVLDDSDHGTSHAATISIPEGGVATSSVMRRRWKRGGSQMHHLIDPSTGLPAATDLDSVTVAASSLWLAEVIAKVALVGGAKQARRLLERSGTSGVLVSSEGDRVNYEVVSNSEISA